MRDLEEKIAQWRKRMAAGGVKAPAVLDELEGHLREEFQTRIVAGDSETEAYALVRSGELSASATLLGSSSPFSLNGIFAQTRNR